MESVEKGREESKGRERGRGEMGKLERRTTKALAPNTQHIVIPKGCSIDALPTHTHQYPQVCLDE